MRGFVPALFLLTAPTIAEGLKPGSYEVTYRLEVPHVERFAIDQTVRVCLSKGSRAMPVLSANNPLAACPASNIKQEDAVLTFDILCPGRRYERSEGHARFTLSATGYQGRIHMIMGGKNMTFVEVQKGRRVDNCSQGISN
jgi:hypothetical protein